jgi:adenylate cyclase
MMRRMIVGSGLGVAAAALAWLIGMFSLSRELENKTYDRRLAFTARPAEARPDIALVEINESSLRALESHFGRWPWPRVVHAGAIDYLARSGARLVVYDVLFTERDTRGSFPVGGQTMSGKESDDALVASVRRAGNVVLLAEATFEGLQDTSRAPSPAAAPVLPGTMFHPGSGFEVRPPLRWPFDDLETAARAVGHNLLVKEADGSVRRARPFIETQGVAVPSLGLAAVLAAEDAGADTVRLDGDTLRIGDRRMPLLADPVPTITGGAPEPSRQVLLRFRGPSVSTTTADGKATYPRYSFFDVLLSEDQVSSGQRPAIDSAAFRDKIVFVGTTFSGSGDDGYTTPFVGAGMAGIQLHAALADDVLSNRFMHRASAGTDAGVALAMGVAAAVLATALPVPWAIAAVCVTVAALVAGLTYAVGAGVWIGVVMPLTAGAGSLFGGVAWQYFVEGREKRQVKRLFGRYVSKDVFEHLLADPSLARLGGQRREMTVLFSDIRGFTTASERGTPEAIVAQLNEYFTAMVEVLFRYQGTLDKFVGDMVMGLFGAPVDDPKHADHAVGAAVEMTAVLDRLNDRWTAEGRPTLDIGIGINSGEMIAGNIGSDTIMSYTVIGDAVNLGARLESLNKDYGTRILISEATRHRLTLAVKTRRIGDVMVKGKTKPVVVHEVVVHPAAQGAES